MSLGATITEVEASSRPGDEAPEPAVTRRLTAIGAVAVLVGIGVGVGLIVARNEGVFSYTLDDPYVHLELARNLAHGHHGVEPGAFSAPSSSILWPLLLIPAWFTGGAVYAPLVLNVVAALLGVAGCAAALTRVLGPVGRARPGVAALLMLALVLVANPIALVPTGMEHTLQVALAAWLAVGLIDVDRGERSPWWLLPVALLLPLVRLEDTGIVLLGAAWLAWRGRRALGVGIAVGVVGSLVGYVAWLHGRSGFWLPFSILSKRDMFRTALQEAYDPSVFVPLLLCGALLWWTRHRELSTRLLAGVAVAGTIGHDALSQIGLFHRYIAYITLFLVVIAGWVERRAVRSALAEGGSNGRVVLWIAAIFAVLDVKLTVDLVGAGGHIWRMQGQMRRIAVEVVDGPVAVNDIGWVSFDNDREVVDLVGLASIDALRHRLAGDPPAWMDDLVRDHGVKLVMIYEHWFDGLPPSWTRLGTLVVDNSPFSEQDRRVAVFAPTPDDARSLRPRLADFAKTLPEGVRFVPPR